MLRAVLPDAGAVLVPEHILIGPYAVQEVGPRLPIVRRLMNAAHGPTGSVASDRRPSLIGVAPIWSMITVKPSSFERARGLLRR